MTTSSSCHVLAVLLGVYVSSYPLAAQNSSPPPAPNQVTVLYDAFSTRTDLNRDFGYAVLIQFEGKRILFDTGNNAALFKANVERLHVDLSHLDLVVLSHRHGDHTSGLTYVLSVNPHVPLYAPADGAFGKSTPSAFFSNNSDPDLPASMRYFNGHVPDPPPTDGTAWPTARFLIVDSFTDVTPHIHLISTLSETPGTRDLLEISLVLDTPHGPIVIVGCSHAGIQNILAKLVSRAADPTVYEVIGGLHLVMATPGQIAQTVSDLADKFHVQRVALGHCTGERAFSAFQKKFGSNYIYAGLGEVFPL